MAHELDPLPDGKTKVIVDALPGGDVHLRMVCSVPGGVHVYHWDLTREYALGLARLLVEAAGERELCNDREQKEVASG